MLTLTQILTLTPIFLYNNHSAVYMQTKSFCEDLTEGKFSFPIIHSVKSFPDDTRLLNILRQKTEDVDVKKHAVQWMERTGSMTYTRDTLKVLHSEVLVEIQELGGHKTLTELVNRLDAELDDIKYTKNDDEHDNDTSSKKNEKKNENENENDLKKRDDKNRKKTEHPKYI